MHRVAKDDLPAVFLLSGNILGEPAGKSSVATRLPPFLMPEQLNVLPPFRIFAIA